MRPSQPTTLALVLLASLSAGAHAATVPTLTLSATGASDGVRQDDSYGWLDHSYHTGDAQLGTWRQYWQPGWGKQDAFFEIPLAALAGTTVISATLEVESEGFGTGYYYGSAYVRHLAPGSAVATGDIALDNPHTWGQDFGWTLYDSYSGDPLTNGSPGVKSFDVTQAVLLDLAAGLSWSSFSVDASRDTGGTLLAAESGEGPRLVIAYEGDVGSALATPIPPAVWLLATALAGLGGLRRRTPAG